jgi:hypothetical protein
LILCEMNIVGFITLLILIAYSLVDCLSLFVKGYCLHDDFAKTKIVENSQFESKLNEE